MRRLATLTLLCAPSAIRGAIPSIAPIVGCDRCLEAADAWEVRECFPEKE